MTNDYTKSVDELVKRKTHPQSMPAFGAQSRSQLQEQARDTERRRIIAALAVAVVAALCVGFAVYRIVQVVTL